jgi:MraZ protein
MIPGINLSGEFECKIDEKGRIIFPSKLKKQISPVAEGKFTIIYGLDKCLVMYPQDEWEAITAEINKLNFFIEENRVFARFFYRGLTESVLDSQSRILLPKAHFDYAGIEKEIILFAYSNRIEIWGKEKYNAMMSEPPADFVRMAERVMGDKNKNNGPD